MFPMIAAIALSLLDNEQKQQNFKAMSKVQAETTRNSPWTGMQAAQPMLPAQGPLGAAAGGALAGYMYEDQNKDKTSPDTAPPVVDQGFQNGPTANGANKYNLASTWSMLSQDPSNPFNQKFGNNPPPPNLAMNYSWK